MFCKSSTIFCKKASVLPYDHIDYKQLLITIGDSKCLNS
jgi:hypothetical protein